MHEIWRFSLNNPCTGFLTFIHWLPALHIAPRWLPTQAPNNSVLHYKGSKHANQTGCRIATPRPWTGSLHWLSALHITLRWLPALHIALHWLPVALQRLPQLGSSSQELQIGSRIATPTPTPYTGSLHPVQGPNINTRSLRAS